MVIWLDFWEFGVFKCKIFGKEDKILLDFYKFSLVRVLLIKKESGSRI